MIRSVKEKSIVVLKKSLILLAMFLLFSSSAPAFAESRSIDELRNSVVRIICYGADGETYIGTGFAVGKTEPVRHIVTNFHVVEPNLDGVAILLSKEDQIKASVIAFDKVKDIAVLELSQDLYQRPPMELGDSDQVKPSQGVYALGFPGDADLIDDTPSGDPDDVTITKGIISKSSIQGGRGIFQIDVSINPGNSGGPLLNEQGQVIGINTFVVTSASGISGAVKIDELFPILESRGIEYLTASNSDSGSTKLWWVLVIAVIGLILLIMVIVFVVILIKKQGKKARGGTPITPVQSSPHSAVSNQKPVLKGLSGYFAGQTVELDQGDLAIGRDARQCQLVFPSSFEEISRKHCTIRYDKFSQTFTLEDSSSNGTYLHSGEKIPAGKVTQLRSGDKFYLSSKDYMFEVRWEHR